MKPSDPVENAEQVKNSAPAQGSITFQEYFLERLERLTALRDQQLQMRPQDKFALRLLARAVYSTYMDCVSLGAGDQASELLDKAQSGAS